MKKILFYINTLENGGAERAICNTASYFAEHDWKVILLTSYRVEKEYTYSDKIQRVIIEQTRTNDSAIRRNLNRIKAIRKICKDYKIDIKREGMNPEISGKLEQNNNKWCITINSKHSVNRQRYTLAHEFAHYCLHRNAKSSFEDTAFFRKEENKTAMEYEANQFAAELLMPERDIKDAISNDIVSLKDLANLFGVSLIAMRTRLTALGYKLVDDEE